jgi:hypothetical protein
MRPERLRRCIVPILLAAGAYFVCQAMAWSLTRLTGLAAPDLPPASSPQRTAGWFMVSTLLIALAASPVAVGIRGGRMARWATLAALIYALHTAGTAIELAVFTKFQGQAYMALAGIFPAIGCAGVLAALRSPAHSGQPNLLRTGDNFSWRLAACWVAFPLVYFLFGSLVSPLVIADYMNESGMLIVPPLGVLLDVQCIRSMIFLIPSIAVIERWQGSRRGLWLSLGWAHAGLVGLAGLVMPNSVLSPTLRLVHAVEIAVDSFVYAGVLVLILTGASTVGNAMNQENREEPA